MATEQEIKLELRRAERRRDSDLSRFENDLARIFDSSIDELVRGLDVGNVSATEAAQQIGRLTEIMQSQGFSDLLSSVEELYAEELFEIRQAQANEPAGVTLSGLDADIVNQLIDFDIGIFQSQRFQFEDQVKAQVMRSVLLGQDIDPELIKEQVSRRAQNNIKTEVRTGLQSFQRTITVRKGIELDGPNARFLYIGPDDKVTRDFCRSVLRGDVLGDSRANPIYTAEEIQRMNNEQGLPVLAAGGGFNCRHRWRLVTDDLEASL